MSESPTVNLRLASNIPFSNKFRFCTILIKKNIKIKEVKVERVWLWVTSRYIGR